MTGAIVARWHALLLIGAARKSEKEKGWMLAGLRDMHELRFLLVRHVRAR